jgi:tetratricopeptide (TPR) repeat protein
MQVHFSVRSNSVPVSLIIILSVCSLWACAPQPEQIRPTENIETLPAVKATASAKPVNSAVIALINQADVLIRESRWPEASSLIERAIRIDSYQADSWTRMAIINLGKNIPEQAIQMAKKSNSLAKNNKSLQAWNWSLIARAHVLSGNNELAQQAAQTSQRLQLDPN